MENLTTEVEDDLKTEDPKLETTISDIPSQDEKSSGVSNVENLNNSTLDTINLSSPEESRSATPEIIDLIEDNDSKENKIKLDTACINYDCQYGKELTLAPGFCLIYYRVKDQKKKQEVCKECLEDAFKFNQDLVKKFEANEYIIAQTYPVRDDLEIIDSDEEITDQENDEHEELLEEQVAFIEENIVDVLNETLKNYDIVDQVEYSQTYLNDKLGSLKLKFEEMDNEINAIQKQVDEVRNELYSEFRKPLKEVCSVDIMDIPYPNVQPIAKPISPIKPAPPVITELKEIPITSLRVVEKPRDPERRSHRNITKPLTYSEQTDNDVVLMETDPVQTLVPVASPTDADVEVVSMSVCAEPPNLPQKGPLERPPLAVGNTYYAVKMSPLGAWGKCKLIEIITRDDDASGKPMYKVKFDTRTKGNISRVVSGKQLAYTEKCNVRMEVGTRVIAVFYTGDILRESYFVGIIAEPLCAANHYRYLVFFDDGYAQYVQHNKVLIVCEESKNVSEDIHKDCQMFINKYLESYPERPMVKLTRGQNFKTELSGKWLSSTVKQIDCSLVQMQFDIDLRTEWIYRGSTRLGPLFSEMQAATNRIEKGPHVRRAFVQKKNVPYVEYTRSDGTETIDLEQENKPAAPRAVARKSTARPQPVPSTAGIPFLPNQQVQQPSSKVVYYSPKNQIEPTDYVPHECSTDCKKHACLSFKILKGYNPLAKPLLCGWHRFTYKLKGKKLMRYRAPCGRSIRNIEECFQYLRITDNELSIDMFDFDTWVYCLAEFTLQKCFRNKRDISNGLEIVPIPCVNYVDNTLPDFTNYSTKREPKEGVNLNLDPEFLCGCDCEDECLDKSKCQCWQLTIKEYIAVNKKTPGENIGYHYKRLQEFVTTGIYECNSRCKCSSRCLNRVVQYPLQLKLQLFKTANRGWGIRCLNDIPKGTFICIYAGSLLTDKMANEGGTNYGDEYLAELDYIEVVERYKEGYESEVEDPSQESEESQEDEDDDENIPFLGGRTEEDDSEYVCEVNVRTHSELAVKTRSRRQKSQGSTDENNTDEKQEIKENTNKETETTKTVDGDDLVTISDDEDNVREPMSFDPSSNLSDDDDESPKFKSVRKMFGADEHCYIMDAKNTGNIGRFLNHSCSPNVFVQNVFVDTHDLRFPWVAFFSNSYIRAGTELTWNYSYDVGSVPGKVIFCHCGSTECRGRLL